MNKEMDNNQTTKEKKTKDEEKRKGGEEEKKIRSSTHKKESNDQKRKKEIELEECNCWLQFRQKIWTSIWAGLVKAKQGRIRGYPSRVRVGRRR